MPIKFTVSVIIPVYNAEAFLEKAIKSALQQPEVLEVIVVNDGITDGSLEITEGLKQKDSRVKIYHHKNNVNRGRSASRNLGIEKASANYIAFLDADDYFLPNRFANDKQIFEKFADAEGVYNAVGFHFYREASVQELKKHTLYTVTREIEPQKLFKTLLYGKAGHFHIDGLTVKSSIFNKTGGFNKKLVVAEDSEMFWKMAITSQLYTGIIKEPLAIRGVHDDNIFDQTDVYKIYTIKMYEALITWCSKNKIHFEIIDELFKWIWIIKEKEKNALAQDIQYWTRLFLPHPKLLFSLLSIKYFPVVRFRQKLFPFLFK
ncbi:glycosyltransferase family 2 protein [Tamlana crocina]|uniref:Glycosyltransferase family 2 protein n=1 Tax=Tamlana crocina TaxID=393006 RepID=A0ABX1D9U2_9FLAO|nr:glycosyltransferase family 2 protein [Tamlana crocina]NJX15035.1 glycosyltransferase family 2 protein [Tamlana crocina]